MGFWAPHVREAVEVFGADRVMFGTDYGPVPIDPKEHVDIVNALAISEPTRRRFSGATRRRFFNLDGVLDATSLDPPDDLNAPTARALPVGATRGRPARGVVAGAHEGRPTASIHRHVGHLDHRRPFRHLGRAAWRRPRPAS